MVKEHTPTLMEISMLGYLKMMGGRHGKGTYTWFDGRKYEGEFKDGEEWNRTLKDKEGKVIGKWANGFRQ